MPVQLDMTVPVAVALAEYNEAADDPHCQRAKLEALARRYTVLRNRETRGSKTPPEPISYDAPAGPPDHETHNTAFPPQPEPRSTRPATLHTPTPTPTSMPKKPPIPGSSDRFNALYKALGYDHYGGGKAFAELCRVSPSTIFMAGRKDLIPATADIIAKAMNVPPEYFTGKMPLATVLVLAGVRYFEGCTRGGATPKAAKPPEDTRPRVSRQTSVPDVGQTVSEQDRLWLEEKKKEAEKKHGPLVPVVPLPDPTGPLADTIANLRNRLAAAQQQADHYTRAIIALEAIA